MRHAVKGRKLKRTSSHKKALLVNLATALFRHKKIKTTVAKAKEARIFVERLITKARKGDIPARRYVARFIKDREVLKELFNEIVVKVGQRPGGYTRVVKLGARRGDGADLAILELVDYNEGEVKVTKKKEKAETVSTEKVTEEKTKAKAEEKKSEASETEHSEDVKSEQEVKETTSDSESSDQNESEQKSETDKEQK
ncbi:MAG: 50S ribosomal protein L17 [Ignavibacteria bacterium]|nr:50S ribosomal protein L17 [Ignavibacteria bacterium]